MCCRANLSTHSVWRSLQKHTSFETAYISIMIVKFQIPFGSIFFLTSNKITLGSKVTSRRKNNNKVLVVRTCRSWRIWCVVCGGGWWRGACASAWRADSSQLSAFLAASATFWMSASLRCAYFASPDLITMFSFVVFCKLYSVKCPSLSYMLCRH